MTPETLEWKVARVVAAHYGVPAAVIERAGVAHLMRMSEDARQVIVNEAKRQGETQREAKAAASVRRAERFAECAA